MSAILGGLFNSRLNMNLREEKGYTYGASAGFDMRRARGPFAARAAVNTEVTVPALREFLAELDRIREAPVTDAELRAARDFLDRRVPAPVRDARARRRVARRACSSTTCPTTSWTATAAAIEAVTADDVQRVARDHIHPEASAIVLVGDHDAVRRGARRPRTSGRSTVIEDAEG